ncbi:hypothetical protein ABPG75_005760 [Micractinium tetrahymenae]
MESSTAVRGMEERVTVYSTLGEALGRTGAARRGIQGDTGGRGLLSGWEYTYSGAEQAAKQAWAGRALPHPLLAAAPACVLVVLWTLLLSCAFTLLGCTLGSLGSNPCQSSLQHDSRAAAMCGSLASASATGRHRRLLPCQGCCLMTEAAAS